MLPHVYTTVQKLLRAKAIAYADNPMLQGMTTREILDTAKDLSPSSLYAALGSEAMAAKYGIYKMTPKKSRNTQWAFSQDVMNKAGGVPYSAGIDPKVQAAEVSKVVTACVNPDDHIVLDQIRTALDQLLTKHGLSVERNELLGQIFKIADDYYKEQES